MSLDAIDAMDPELLPTKKELLTIANSLYGDIIHKVQQILTHLIVFRQPKDEPAPFDKSIGSEGSYKALPAALDDQALFALLSHLVMALGAREGRGESEEGEVQLVRCLLLVLRIASVVPRHSEKLRTSTSTCEEQDPAAAPRAGDAMW